MDEGKATVKVAQEPLLLTEAAVDILVDILLSLNNERGERSEPTTDAPEAA